MALSTLLYEVSPDHVATITLNRPEVMNAFNQTMCEDFRTVWADVRDDDAVHAVVLRGAGERAFCAGLDRKRGYDQPSNVWNENNPVTWLLPKLNRVWKPIVCAVHGMAVGGSLYWINESDIVIASDDAQFCDAHVSIGTVSARCAIGFSRRIPYTEAMRIALMGSDERVSAKRAYEIGYVSELVPYKDLHARAHEIAALIAGKPPAVIQGTVKAVWESLDMPLTMAWRNAPNFSLVGNAAARTQTSTAPEGKRERRVR